MQRASFIHLHLSVLLPRPGAISPKPGLHKKMAGSFWVGLLGGEAHTAGSSSTAFFLQGKHSLLFRLLSKGPCLLLPSALDDLVLTAAGPEGQAGSSHCSV